MCPSSAEPTKNHCISSNCTPRRSSPTRKARGSNPPGRTISLWQKRCRRLFLCCIVENWQFHHTILGRGFTVLSNHFRAVSPTWCPLSLPLSGIWQEKGQFFWEKQNKSCCFQNVSISPQPILNCTPFVRQYDILSNRWGDLLCQEENRTNDIRRNSRKWL